MMNFNRRPRFAKIMVMVVLGIAALAAAVMLLWNWLMPDLFAGARPIGYWQALGLLALSKILFGGLRGHGTPAGWHRERWQKLTPEERQRLESGFARCFGAYGSKGTDTGQG